MTTTDLPGTSLFVPHRPGEGWWGGLNDDGLHMPFGRAPLSRDLARDLSGNQGAPLLLSDQGRYLWSDAPFAFEVDGTGLRLRGEARLEEGFGTLRGAFLAASARHFPPSGTLPDERLFTRPQYNTWIEHGYGGTQEGVLAYARGILDHGFPTGVLMIDDNWHRGYGHWDFDRKRFPDPAALVRQLQEMGFPVMLWVCPFVSPDSEEFRWLERRGLLLLDRVGQVALRRWWNGYSAVLDLTHPGAVTWMNEQLARLQADYGVDGFKLDAGDPIFYRADDRMVGVGGPAAQCEAWARLGLRFPLNEYRACWKLGGQALAQRLKDKAHSWDEFGLASLIPSGLAQGLIGHPYTCADMVGGGDIETFIKPGFQMDAELFVRYAQAAALFPMLQFSTAPWRVLDGAHLALCREMAELHVRHADEILTLARHAARTGEPILRSLEYVYPHQGYAGVGDQFLLGDDLLVAPVLTKGAREREVVFPPGRWRGDDGHAVEGPARLVVPAPLERLPRYRKETP